MYFGRQVFAQWNNIRNLDIFYIFFGKFWVSIFNLSFVIKISGHFNPQDIQHGLLNIFFYYYFWQTLFWYFCTKIYVFHFLAKMVTFFKNDLAFNIFGNIFFISIFGKLVFFCGNGRFGIFFFRSIISKLNIKQLFLKR